MERRVTKKIKAGNTFIGGDSRITVQSMLNVPSTDIEGSVRQSQELEKAGCDTAISKLKVEFKKGF